MKKLISRVSVGILIGLAILFSSQLFFKTENTIVSVGLVTDLSGLKDRSFSEGIWEGIQQYKAVQPLKVSYVETQTATERLENLNLQAKTHDIVVVPGATFAEEIFISAQQNPKTAYVYLDAQPETLLPNMIAVNFKEEQAGYLAGIAAAMQTQSNKVGFIGGKEIEAVANFENGFIQGVYSVDSTIQVTSEYVHSFSNQAQGTDSANGLYASGHDVIFAAAGATGLGVIEAAKNQSLNENEVWVIGVDQDQFQDGVYAPGKSVVLTSAIKRLDRAIAELLADIIGGTAQFGTTQTLDIRTGAVGIPTINPNITNESHQRLLMEANHQLSTGQIQIESLTPVLQTNE